jgi:hypothetical protein
MKNAFIYLIKNVPEKINTLTYNSSHKSTPNRLKTPVAAYTNNKQTPMSAA